MTKTTKLAAGYYAVTAPGAGIDWAEVTVTKNPALAGPDKWIAYAMWDKYTVTDPLPTKAEAVYQAGLMLADATTI